MPPKKKPQMTDEERSAMVAKMQADLEDFVAEKSKAHRKKKESEPEDTRSIDEIAEDIMKHPFFMKEIDYSKPLPPEVEGLMQLKYESEDPTMRADSYRDDGNEEFKKKNYPLAIDNYTEGIKSKSPDAELNAVLYTNRAAAQFHLRNYRSSFTDCIYARKFKPDHMKAVIRGAQCCFEMKKFADSVRWCDAVLMMEPDHAVILQLRTKADKAEREKVRDERRQAAKERKEEEAERSLLKTIQGKGIKVHTMKVSEDSKIDPLLLTALETHNPTGAKVHINNGGQLVWPVIFFYPEYAECDFISGFEEQANFWDHLCHMFSSEAPPATWDVENKYKAENIEIFFENKDDEKLYRVSPQSLLLDALRHKKYLLYAGTPGFIMVVKGSKFAHDFISRYRNH